MDSAKGFEDYYEALERAALFAEKDGIPHDLYEQIGINESRVRKAASVGCTPPRLSLRGKKIILDFEFPDGPTDPNLTFSFPLKEDLWIRTSLYYQGSSLTKTSIQLPSSHPENIHEFLARRDQSLLVNDMGWVTDPMDGLAHEIWIEGELGKALEEIHEGRKSTLKSIQGVFNPLGVSFSLHAGDGREFAVSPKVPAMNMNPDTLKHLIESFVANNY